MSKYITALIVRQEHSKQYIKQKSPSMYNESRYSVEFATRNFFEYSMNVLLDVIRYARTDPDPKVISSKICLQHIV